jgi:hypothetical protein
MRKYVSIKSARFGFKVLCNTGLCLYLWSSGPVDVPTICWVEAICFLNFLDGLFAHVNYQKTLAFFLPVTFLKAVFRFFFAKSSSYETLHGWRYCFYRFRLLRWTFNAAGAYIELYLVVSAFAKACFLKSIYLRYDCLSLATTCFF